MCWLSVLCPVLLWWWLVFFGLRNLQWGIVETQFCFCAACSCSKWPPHGRSLCFGHSVLLPVAVGWSSGGGIPRDWFSWLHLQWLLWAWLVLLVTLPVTAVSLIGSLGYTYSDCCELDWFSWLHLQWLLWAWLVLLVTITVTALSLIGSLGYSDCSELDWLQWLLWALIWVGMTICFAFIKLCAFSLSFFSSLF